MDRIKALLLGLVVFTTFFAFNVYADDSLITSSPIGYWKAIDRLTGKPKSIVQILQAENNTLVGKIIKVFPEVSNQKSDSNVGKVILSGLVAHQNQWKNGKILDPDNGKTYDCSLQLGENGKKLNVLGYIGIPLLGRLQIWERVDLMSDKF
jgi:uncharacterized protein (DUF2147 family)